MYRYICMHSYYQHAASPGSIIYSSLYLSPINCYHLYSLPDFNKWCLRIYTYLYLLFLYPDFFNHNCIFILLIRYINSYLPCFYFNRDILLWLWLFNSFRFTRKYIWDNLFSCITDYRKAAFYIILLLYSFSIDSM